MTFNHGVAPGGAPSSGRADAFFEPRLKRGFDGFLDLRLI